MIHPRSSIGLLAVAFAAALASLAARPAAAHPLDLGYLRIAGAGARLSASLDLDAAAAAHLLGVEPSALDAAALDARAAELAERTLRRAAITTERGPCRWSGAGAALTARTATLTVEADCPSGSRTIRWPLPFVEDPALASTFQLLVKAQLPGGDHLTMVDRSQPALALTRASRLGVGAFVWSGVEHIGAAPGEWRDAGGWRLPDGLDHILFLLALMLAGGTLLQLLGIATGFTLGHSITLALAGLGLVRPPASVIEPLIALSIAWVAARTLLGRREQHRWKLATAFGLVHGFGFAGALAELELPPGELVPALVGYNAGVELGQVAIVLVLAPAVLLLQRRPRLAHTVVRALAAVICVAGLYWFAQRVFG